MDNQAILAGIEKIVQQALGLNDLALTMETAAKDVERWDSVANIGIIMGIESHFNIRFGLGELDSMKT